MEIKFYMEPERRLCIMNKRRMLGFKQTEFGKMIKIKSYGSKERGIISWSVEDIKKLFKAFNWGERLKSLTIK